MESIVACRDTISERFPVASFTVNVPEARLYEVVCATDPRLLHTDNAARRTQANFFSSRIGGLLPARRGANTYILPAEQLRRFAGARRLYYALGTYAGPRGEQPRFSIAPDALDEVPCLRVAADFTGQSLDRRRLGAGVAKADAHYGGRERTILRWGGDAVLEAERATTLQASAAARPSAPASRPVLTHYDDGFDPSLWSRTSGHGYAPAGARIVAYAGAAGVGYEDAAALRADRRVTDEPARYGAAAALLEDGAQAHARQLARPVDHRPEPASQRYGRREPIDAVSGVIEDGAQAWASGRARAIEIGPSRYGAPQALSSSSFEDAATLRSLASALVQPLGPARIGNPRARSNRTAAAGRRDGDGERGGEDPSPAGHGRHPEYSERALEQSLPVGPATHPLGQEPAVGSSASAPSSPTPTIAPTTARRRLSVVDKVRILRVVARAESGDDRYAAIYADGEFNDPNHPFYQNTHVGLSWGLLLFTQRSGALGRVLALAKAREDAMLGDPQQAAALPAAQRFEGLFGEHWAALLERTDAARNPDPEARLQPVGGASLWEQPWLDRFRAAGAVAHVQAAQNQVGVETYFDAILPIARALDLRTAKRLAVLVDRVVHMGVGAGTAWIMDTAGPITSEALREQALAAVGFAGDLAGFARSRRLDAPGWTPAVHAALTAALRELDRSPISLPDGATALARIAAAVDGRPEQARVRALLDRPHDELDDSAPFDL